MLEPHDGLQGPAAAAAAAAAARGSTRPALNPGLQLPQTDKTQPGAAYGRPDFGTQFDPPPRTGGLRSPTTDQLDDTLEADQTDNGPPRRRQRTNDWPQQQQLGVAADPTDAACGQPRTAGAAAAAANAGLSDDLEPAVPTSNVANQASAPSTSGGHRSLSSELLIATLSTVTAADSRGELDLPPGARQLLHQLAAALVAPNQ